jgi:hypothetical protein
LVSSIILKFVPQIPQYEKLIIQCEKLGIISGIDALSEEGGRLEAVFAGAQVEGKSFLRVMYSLSHTLKIPKSYTVISQRNEGSGTITIGPLPRECRKRRGRDLASWGGRGSKAS